MEILSVLQGLQQYGKTTTDKVDSAVRKGKGGHSVAENGDSVRLSGEGRLVNRARQAAMEAPEVRAEKVQRLKELVEKGAYEIDTQKTAAKIVEEELELFL